MHGTAGTPAGTGYFDQAHLTRAFQALAGCSRSRWLANEFGFVQDTVGAPDENRPHD
ncbi:MAG: hypothetical protein QOE51_3408 [Actinoplanes sp.]|jgi:AraC-like DNA-binding protein|nr:hypothetical protein [Actinoplanes sp.]